MAVGFHTEHLLYKRHPPPHAAGWGSGQVRCELLWGHGASSRLTGGWQDSYPVVVGRRSPGIALSSQRHPHFPAMWLCLWPPRAAHDKEVCFLPGHPEHLNSSSASSQRKLPLKGSCDYITLPRLSPYSKVN